QGSQRSIRIPWTSWPRAKSIHLKSLQSVRHHVNVYCTIAKLIKQPPITIKRILGTPAFPKKTKSAQVYECIVVVNDDHHHTLEAQGVLLSNAKTSRGLVSAFGIPLCELPGSSTWARPDLL
ncbi:MAG: hypothetical protein ACKPKO_41530, partial [Candidatus Fonsibacter sp.]